MVNDDQYWLVTVLMTGVVMVGHEQNKVLMMVGNGLKDGS